SHVVPEETSLRIEQAPLRIDGALRLRAVRIVPRYVDVQARPHALPVEDRPAVRVLAEEVGTVATGHGAARLRRGDVEAGLPVGVVGEQVLPAMSAPLREETELAVQVPPTAWDVAQAAGVGGVGIIEYHPGRGRAAVHQVRVEEFALRVEDDVEGTGRRLARDERGE